MSTRANTRGAARAAEHASRPPLDAADLLMAPSKNTSFPGNAESYTEAELSMASSNEAAGLDTRWGKPPRSLSGVHPLGPNARVRRGKWTADEKVYAKSLIDMFVAGTVPACDNGITMRAFLAEKLYCDRMRISKKCVGAGRRRRRRRRRCRAPLTPPPFPGTPAPSSASSSSSGAGSCRTPRSSTWARSRTRS